MVIILNNKLKEKKKLYLALSKLFGIGYTYSKNLCRRIGVSEKGYVENLTQPLIKQISRNINVECMIERELQAIILANINNKIKTKSYQGIRHLNGLPVNGQNTRNNSQTAKKLLKENANKVKKN